MARWRFTGSRPGGGRSLNRPLVTIHTCCCSARPAWGKSHLAIALGLKACEQGYWTLFTTAAGLIASAKTGYSVIAAASLDRLLHHSITVNIKGDSYRLRKKLKAGLLRPARRPCPGARGHDRHGVRYSTSRRSEIKTIDGGPFRAMLDTPGGLG